MTRDFYSACTIHHMNHMEQQRQRPSNYAGYLAQQEKAHFINEFGLEVIAEWVLFKHLEMFCRENGFAKWKREKQKKLRIMLIDEV